MIISASAGVKECVQLVPETCFLFLYQKVFETLDGFWNDKCVRFLML